MVTICKEKKEYDFLFCILTNWWYYWSTNLMHELKTNICQSLMTKDFHHLCLLVKEKGCLYLSAIVFKCLILHYIVLKMYTKYTNAQLPQNVSWILISIPTCDAILRTSEIIELQVSWTLFIGCNRFSSTSCKRLLKAVTNANMWHYQITITRSGVYMREIGDWSYSNWF